MCVQQKVVGWGGKKGQRGQRGLWRIVPVVVVVAASGPLSACKFTHLCLDVQEHSRRGYLERGGQEEGEKEGSEATRRAARPAAAD